ncbi:MAG: dGTP triphosphohydrolase [Flavobacteriaceae bacterium]
MNWDQLLSLKRFGDVNKRLRKEQDENRLGFEVDYDRIIFSSPFRSLQDKTQVIPLSDTDFVHTRLTHSLEVSVVARTLGRVVGVELLKKYPHLEHDLGYKPNDFGAIVAAAALAHDIGNPPFGHSGEKAIGEFYTNGEGQKYKTMLTDKEYQDLISFEGNANGFKILTETKDGVDGGLRLSYATLGAFMKYPKESLPVKPTSHIADKKYGFFQDDKVFFEEVANELGLKQTRQGDDISFSRHPLTFLVEAADDICYTIIDFEDGINLGLIDEDFALEYLINLVKDAINIDKYKSLNTTGARIAYLRSLSVSALINEAVRVFVANEESILKGDYSHGLIDKCKYEPQINDIIKISIDNIYQSDEVIEKEIVGYQVISKLLEVYTTAVNNKAEGKLSSYDELILKTLPKSITAVNESLYKRLLHVSGYVASLSDSKALLLYRKLMGIIH